MRRHRINATRMLVALAIMAFAAPVLARTTADADFQRLDRNNDRRISFAELQAMRDAPISDDPSDRSPSRLKTLVLRAVFQRLDANRDGVVSLDEYRRAGEGVRA